MFPKSHRLPGYLIPQISQKGKSIVTPLFVLKYLSIEQLKNCFIESLDYSLVAFIFSKKLEKKAVIRNRSKRRLSQAVRQLLPQLKSPLILVFFAKKKILQASFEEIHQEVEKIFNTLINGPMGQLNN